MSHTSIDVDREVTRADVEGAARRLLGLVRRTPLLTTEHDPGQPRVALKLECLQASGSFKLRGATNRILVDDGRHERVVARSGGNHGIAVAHACQRLRLRADVFVSVNAPAGKVHAIERRGGHVHRVDAPPTELAARARDYAERHDALFVHPFDDPVVVAGQGTVGLEILEQCPDVTHVVVAVGGGGLAAGVAVAVADSAEIVPTEPRECPTLARALEAGQPIPVEVGGIAVDSLGAVTLGNVAYSILSPRVTAVALVDEEEILAAQRLLWSTYRLAVEPAAACAWAATVRGHLDMPRDASVVVIACGANIDLEASGRQLETGFPVA